MNNESTIKWLNALLKKRKAKKLHYYSDVVITSDKQFYDIKTGEQLHPSRNKLSLKKQAGEIHTINTTNCYRFYFEIKSQRKRAIMKNKLYIAKNNSGVKCEWDMRTYTVTPQHKLGSIVILDDDEELRQLEPYHVKALLAQTNSEINDDDIDESEIYSYLQVSNKGRLMYGTVFNKKLTGLHNRSHTAPYKCHNLKIIKDKSITMYAHRIMAIVFLWEQYKALLNKGIPHHLIVVNHRDANKHNNNLDNLEWVTTAENNRHAREYYKNKHIDENN
ncbi:HNH endonuclease [Staphylococcus pseudintermedius]|uniref:HNH endonuclease n=1 Tax=Staphylococcus pseudintermedius TaxID=283734 RepID=UPI002032A09D|nr:HNH endonuclease [Staphylococcus pseudintermedius]WQC57233.1 HNH endonuclease [Staphylococcus pseudintermedius]